MKLLYHFFSFQTLYIIKPLVHLSCLSARGQKNWMPWSVSFIIDLVSLRLFSEEAKNVNFTKEEREELCRRRISLLLYILRSPFYDKISRQRILSLLSRISKNIPLARFVAEPVAKYLPHWQNTYFYMWSSWAVRTVRGLNDGRDGCFRSRRRIKHS